MSNSINIYKQLEMINENLILIKDAVEKNNEIHEKSSSEIKDNTSLIINEMKNSFENMKSTLSSSFINLDDLDEKEDKK